ncbi:hypothetical protein [Dactylosporangium sp. NPDC048998]|uniref:hypothetical protein n=1 Tax=Dactylosporangium sp. NPDC048998 TaxID=3363976 RepID=UPI0037210B07
MVLLVVGAAGRVDVRASQVSVGLVEHIAAFAEQRDGLEQVGTALFGDVQCAS